MLPHFFLLFIYSNSNSHLQEWRARKFSFSDNYSRCIMHFGSCRPLGRIFNIATNVSFVSCSFLRCSRCSFPCVFSLVYIVIVFVRCFICSFNRTVYRSRLKLLELVNINRQWQLQLAHINLSFQQGKVPWRWSSLESLRDLHFTSMSDV